MNQSQAVRASLTTVWAALDTLRAAARDDDPDRYRAALAAARELELSDEQIIDAYRRGHFATRCGASFDWQGVTR